MKIYIGNDHAGVEMATTLKSFLEEKFSYEVEHCGTYTEESVDYPTYGKLVAEKVKADSGSLGIVICGTGIGISIAANKVEGIRCANCVSPYMAEMARQHNDANVLALGARLLDIPNALLIVETFMETSFEGGRHEKRVCMLS